MRYAAIDFGNEFKADTGTVGGHWDSLFDEILAFDAWNVVPFDVRPLTTGTADADFLAGVQAAVTACEANGYKAIMTLTYGTMEGDPTLGGQVETEANFRRLLTALGTFIDPNDVNPTVLAFRFDEIMSPTGDATEMAEIAALYRRRTRSLRTAFPYVRVMHVINPGFGLVDFFPANMHDYTTDMMIDYYWHVPVWTGRTQVFYEAYHDELEELANGQNINGEEGQDLWGCSELYIDGLTADTEIMADNHTRLQQSLAYYDTFLRSKSRVVGWLAFCYPGDPAQGPLSTNPLYGFQEIADPLSAAYSATVATDALVYFRLWRDADPTIPVPFYAGVEFGGVEPADETAQDPQPTRAKLEVDWNNDDVFNENDEDVTAYVIGALQTQRGKEYASELIGRSVAGELSTTLDNSDGRFSPFSVDPDQAFDSPLLKVRAWSLTPITKVLFTGYLDHIVPEGGSWPVARLHASGVLRNLADPTSRAYPLPQTDVMPGDVINEVLDNIGHPADARDIEDGTVPVANWFAPADGINALDACAQMEELEFGFLYEDTNWGVGFQGRYYRHLNSRVVKAIFSDDQHAVSTYEGAAHQSAKIFNAITAKVSPYTAQSIADLWTLNEQPYLAPGASLTLKATVSSGYVNPWTLPVVATDVISATGTLAVVEVSRSATHITFTITNSHVTEGATLTTVKARGVQYVAGDQIEVESSDLASQVRYRKRMYTLGSPWYSNLAYAQSSADLLVSRHKDPSPIATIAIPAKASTINGQNAAERELSDRVVLVADEMRTEFGFDDVEMFIESIGHVIQPGGPWQTVYQLSEAAAQQDFWILDHPVYSILGSTTVPAF